MKNLEEGNNTMNSLVWIKRPGKKAAFPKGTYKEPNMFIAVLISTSTRELQAEVYVSEVKQKIFPV